MTEKQTTYFGTQRPNLTYSWVVVLSAALFFFYIFMQVNLFNAISEDLTKEFHFNAKQLGNLAAFYFYGNVIFLFPAGILLDRFSVKKLLLIVFILSVGSTYIFSATSSFWVMNLTRLCVGIAGAFALLSAVKLASRWFEPRHMALVVGMVVTMAMIGGAIAQTPLVLLTDHIGWRKAMQLVALFGAVLAIIQLMIVRDEPKWLEKVDREEHQQLEQIGFWHSLGIALANPQNWLSGIYMCLANLPVFVFGGVWGVPYLTQAHHLTHVQATQVTTMLFIGMIMGAPLAGTISDSLKLRKPPIIAGIALSTIVMLFIMFTTEIPMWANICLFFLLGFSASFHVVGYPVITENNAHTITATATSIGSTLVMAGGMLIPLFGWLLDLTGNAEVHTAADFLRANYLMLAGLIVALFCSLFLRETRCQQLNQLEQ